ncbi:MAG TPA: LysR family transcriptional regulator [Pusillimonas sp.]|jgi:LysR family transcriptional activator of nhaA|nr:LysR family transcriptional regulator [Pusillimonas sp.]MBC43174.1 LysR family transcriptional regulator [Pusillimonas sp.]HBT32050.1 LysR family transcriptional regulator [Pusillimonas sp.]HCP76900.1 LysR family transcriptional regulator [Pusillimonas sp.]|tara:strand:- start:96282 stop:97184 length:903 start_codon:yes stop_codon:yes gene_type:complete
MNYRHLYYFWIVGKEGGFARAANRLGVAVQTVSAQVRALERQLGHELLKPDGRGVVLTDAGQRALIRADEIFQLGKVLQDEVAQIASRPVMRFSVGLSDGLSKLAAHALLQPVLEENGLRLLCHEGELEALLAELVQHRLDVVLASQPAPPNINLRLLSDRVGTSQIDWFGVRQWVTRQQQEAFPANLATLPVLLPTRHSMLRLSLDQWFESRAIKPNIVGEFEDSALMAVFGAKGMGIFPASRLGASDWDLLPQLRRLGECLGVQEDIYAIRHRRSDAHPLLQRVIRASQLASGKGGSC